MKTTENKIPKQNLLCGSSLMLLRKKSVCKNEAKLAFIVPLEIALTACNFRQSVQKVLEQKCFNIFNT